MSIQPIHVAAYIEILGREFEKPTVKQHLAAIRVLFDWLVIGQVIPTNPATSVRGPKHDVTRGTTPVLASMEVRQILDHIDTSNIVGLRDRALIALMVFSFARISAALSMRVDDYFLAGDRWWVRLQEKGGKRHEMPAHRELQIFMNKYVEVGQLWREPNAPLFRAFGGGNEFPSALSRIEAYRMIQRRAGQASIATKLCCHSFRATGITIYLSNGGTLEKAQAMAAHKSPRTTKLYDRTDDAVKLEEVERIAI